ncbi:hypothetical protein T05_15214, partial [Trichinella murrelli]
MNNVATSLNPQVEQMISTFLSYAPDLTKRQLSKQEIISWLEYSFVSTALDTLPSLLILGVTGSIFHQQNRLILDHSRLNRMNSTRSTCVIIVSKNPCKQETTSWREYTFVSTALDTLPSMLILGVT